MTGTLPGCLGDDELTIVLATTTSTYDSGLLEYLLDRYDPEEKVRFKLVAVGTGQALRMGSDGDADLLIVHARIAELELMADGHGVERREFMYNQFLLAGPKDDPANVSGQDNITEAFRALYDSQSHFASRGDNSGTHQREKLLWAITGLDYGTEVETDDNRDWYHQTGQGMGATLAYANEKEAYVLVDEGTWYARSDLDELSVLLEGDPLLFNQYGVIVVNSTARPEENLEPSMAFMEWLTEGEGQDHIGNFTKNGRKLFVPNYTI